MTYADKLKDPRWQRKRLEIFNRDNFTCQNCSCVSETLHAHHRYYEYGKDPWDYPDELLITLCLECHEQEESYKNEAKRVIYHSLLRVGLLNADILSLAAAIDEVPQIPYYPNIHSTIKFALTNKEAFKALEEAERAYDEKNPPAGGWEF